MTTKRKRGLGDNPLEVLIPGGTPKGITYAEPRTAEEAGAPTARARFTAQIPADVVERAKNAVYWTPGLTLAKLIENAIRDELAKIEKKNGGPFPARQQKNLTGGRPLKD
jgi:hypothetical protein